jgi:hypothetical protein
MIQSGLGSVTYKSIWRALMLLGISRVSLLWAKYRNVNIIQVRRFQG